MKHAATDEKKYIIALDQGTTSSRAVLFDRQARAKAAASFPITQYYPKPGWVEHDPLEIYRTQKDALMQVIAQAGARPEDIAALGITNQRETVVLWDKTPARLCTMRSCGSAGAPRRCALSLSMRGTRSASGTGRDSL